MRTSKIITIAILAIMAISGIYYARPITEFLAQTDHGLELNRAAARIEQCVNDPAAWEGYRHNPFVVTGWRVTSFDTLNLFVALSPFPGASRDEVRDMSERVFQPLMACVRDSHAWNSVFMVFFQVLEVQAVDDGKTHYRPSYEFALAVSGNFLASLELPNDDPKYVDREISDAMGKTIAFMDGIFLDEIPIARNGNPGLAVKIRKLAFPQK